MPIADGTRLGAYEILSLIGRGGMGEVYRARDTKLGRDVALKILPATFINDSERVARFRREAQVLAALNHPHIAQIYGLEEADGTPFLELELVDGESLDQRIARGSIPVDEALDIAKQVAEALEAAHEKGIIHRDLKPANVAVSKDGQVKILDFGLAKEVERTSGSVDVTNSPTITSPALMTGVGMILGTAAYMSPEQAKGRGADKRSDVWAFGCVCYEMLTGHRAFDGEDVSETLAAVLRAEPDWNLLPATVPDHIRQLLRRCCEKDRGKRVADLGVARFLIEESFSAGSLEHQTSRRTPWNRALPAVAAAILAGTVVDIGVRLRQPAPPSRVVTRFTYDLPATARFTNAGRSVLTISPDGSRVAFVANTQVFVKSLSQIEPTPLRGAAGDPATPNGMITSPVFSPDGESLAFYSRGELKRIPIGGGAAVTLSTGIPNPFGMSWDGDGLLIGAGAGGVLRVPASGGAPTVLIAGSENEIAHGPQMLPGNRAVLYTVGAAGQSWDSARIVAQNVASTDRKTIITGGSDGRYLPTGHLVYSVGGVLFAVPFDIEKLEISGTPRPVVEGVARAFGNMTGTAQFAVSRTGSLVYVSGPVSGERSGSDLVTFDRAGRLESLNLPKQSYAAPRFSPQGHHLAVGVEDGNGSNIWIYDLSGKSTLRQLTFDGRSRFPIWTRDGTRITFQVDREGDQGLFWQPADGSTGPERLTTAAKGESHLPVGWLPKGDRLMFVVKTDRDYSLSTLSLQTHLIEPFGTDRFTSLPHASISPDGRWVAYQETKPRLPITLMAQSIPPTSKHRIGQGMDPFWAPDGRTLYFVTAPGVPQFSAVTVTTAPGFDVSKQVVSVPRPLPVAGGLNLPDQYDVSPDGEQFVIVTNTLTRLGNQIEFVLNWFTELQERVPTR